MQLERILQSQGFGSRKECRAMIRHHLVTVNGEACDDPFAEFSTAGLHFSVADIFLNTTLKNMILLQYQTNMVAQISGIHIF